MCVMTHTEVLLLCDIIYSFVCVQRTHVKDMTLSYVWHDSFICVTWLTHMCDSASHICVTWLTHMCNMTHSYVWLWLTQMWDDARGGSIAVWHDSFTCVWHDSCTCVWHDSFICVWHDSLICVTWLTHMWHAHVTGLTRSCCCCVTWLIHMCVIWLIHMCDMTHSYATCTCVTPHAEVLRDITRSVYVYTCS